MLRDDVVSSTLKALRVSGTLLLCEKYASPWAIDLPDSAGLASLFGLPAGVHVVAFHMVESGQLELLDAGETLHVVKAGEIAICFGGAPHRMSSGQPGKIASMADVLGDAPLPFARHLDDEGPGTRLVCGAFLMRNTQLNPLFAALPRVATMSTDAAVAPGETSPSWLTAVASQLRDEIVRPRDGSAFVVERLVELLCAQVVRRSAVSVQTPGSSWFHALRDPALAAVLSRLHASPADAWTVETMAACASLSRSRFAARFQHTLGESPMQYLTRWRMNLASRLLGDNQLSVERVALQVGYSSLAAFSRSFRAQVGVSPSAYRAGSG